LLVAPLSPANGDREEHGSRRDGVEIGAYLTAEDELDGRHAWSDVANLVPDTPGVRKLAG
jgi:hypothetical protein